MRLTVLLIAAHYRLRAQGVWTVAPPDPAEEPAAVAARVFDALPFHEPERFQT